MSSAPDPASVPPDLVPGRARRLPRALRPPGATGADGAVPLWARVALAVLVTVALGTWGFLELPVSPRLTVVESLYFALKLYTLDLGPGDGSAPGPDWQILVGLVLAAALLARGVLGLARARVSRLIVRHGLSGHVIVCGSGVYGTRLAETLGADHDVVLIDIAAGPAVTAAAAHLWPMTGDAVQAATLLAAGVPRAHWVVSVTGDDFVNSQVVSAVRTLAAGGRVRDGLQVLVQVEDPSLARFLEENDAGSVARAARIVVSPFSAAAIAADALLEDSRVGDGARAAPLMRMRSGAGPNLLLAGDHPLIDSLVLAALRRWRVRTLRELEAGTGRTRPPMHVSVYGPGAEARVARLRARWRPEPEVLVLEARDSSPSGDPSADGELWLRRPGRADHAIVVCASELDGIALTLTVARALGGRARITRVTTQRESALDTHLEQRTAASDQLASTEVKSVAELGARPERMQRLSELERLQAALAAPDGAESQRARERARALLSRSELEVVSDSGWRWRPAERPLLQALLSRPAPGVPLSAIVRAGLRVTLDNPENLREAAEALAAAEDPHAAAAWCAWVQSLAARPPTEQLSDLSRAHADPVGAHILALRRAALGDVTALAGDRGQPLPGGEPVVILAGAAASMSPGQQRALEPLLERALQGAPGVLLSGGTAVGMPGVAGRIARRLGLTLVGYVPAGQGDADLYAALRETPNATSFTLAEPLAMWTDIIASELAPERVALLACPGGPVTIQEMALARALGARVAFVDPAGEATSALDDVLVLGAGGVLELPADPMTVRAFLRPSTVPEELREQIARHLHREYRRRHRARKDSGDPSLAPWEELLPALKDSNRAQADDIPNKLALIGKRLVPAGAPLVLAPGEIELLAEVEHGRWNAERLADGWRAGQRQAEHRTSPNLRAWVELSDEVRDWDREAVSDLPAALADTGWGVSDA
ncbi:MAG TPA: NAD-binding protein [Solirubrobacteraceae bacterium]|nr:NAD-binding protein [Solirubrobacteraceae bacterium]